MAEKIFKHMVNMQEIALGIIITSVIGGVITFIFWGGKNWITNLQSTLKDIKKLLSDVKTELENVKLDNQLTRSTVQEIDTNTTLKINNIDRKLMHVEDKVAKLDSVIDTLNQQFGILKSAHQRNHPEDKFNH